MKIQDCVALVTGSNRGIGKCFVEMLLAAGAAHVYAAARDPAKLDFPGDKQLSPLRLDITSAEQVGQAANRCRDVTLLINNAGISTYQPALSPTDPSAARAEMETNYFGTLAMCQAFAPILGANGGGALINVLSSASLVCPPDLASYSASKAAAMRMTQGVRAQLRDQGTQVVAVYFGNADTDMTASVGGVKTPPSEIVSNTLAAVRNGEEDVYANARVRDVVAKLRTDPKGVERDMETRWRAGRPKP